ncbi:hypothetical protein LAZ67_13002539 [Cordylochernes scorpioides]|uniref:Reverse transcriptase domain-containing protein n=1 Tax=Cordylochernes scorpioides TaxID=51811 RepID=A0ABY6L4N7_9ARAC|nr:hypothetical protein LAZ67_13002539 [Cordylochernes scorpioides]
MAQIQPPETFDFSTPNEWPKWRKRFERYLVVSGMKKKEEADKIDLFMYLMGDRADDIFRTFKFEKEEEATKIDSVLKAFDSHFCVRKNIIYERAKFNSRIQEDREPVDEFITSLYKLADSCEFEGLHEQLIRDRIVVGVRDKALSERMQLDSELTLEKAVKMVRQQEAVRQQQVDLQRPSASQKVSQVKFNSKKQSPKQRQQPSRKKEKSAKTRSRCPKCGGFTHREGQACRAEGQRCNLCSKTGHFANCCPDKQAKTAEVKAVSELDEEIGFLLEVSAVEDSSNLDDDEGECRRRWTAEIQVNGKQVKFKLDSQAVVTCVPLCLFKKMMGQQRLVKSDINIRAAEFSELQTVGMFISTLRNGNYDIKEKIYVIRRLSEPLLSRRACELLNLARRIEVVATRINPIKEFPEVFEGLGQIGNPYEIKLKPGAKPYAVRTPRRVPIPLMEKLKTRLEELEKAGIIAQVNVATEWCAPTVIAGKPNGDIRLCVDLSRLNEHVQREVHPMPVVEHMLGQLGEARFFSKLDANSGFHQIPLSPDCQHLTTFITPFGRYKYCRMPFGISLAPEYFQRVMSIILQGMDGVMCYLDDILIFASDSKTHDRILRLVLRKLKEAKVTLNKAKCVFGVPRINFLGHILDEDGIRPDPAKIEAVARMPAPTDVHGVRRFLGMVNPLGRKLRTTLPIAPENLNPKLVDSQALKRKEGRRRKDMKSRYDRRCGATDMEELSEGDTVWITDMRTWGIVKQKASTPSTHFSRRDCVIVTVVLLMAATLIAVTLSLGLPRIAAKRELYFNPVLPVSPTVLHTFPEAAVVTDGDACAPVGKSILKQGGSAVDAAIALLACDGVVNPQSMGLGGGFLMTIYNRSSQTVEVLDAREVAPANATVDMFKGNASLISEGGLAIGVPGELKGYIWAYKKYGRLNWSELFQPAISLARNGFRVGPHLAKQLNSKRESILAEPSLKEAFFNNATGNLYEYGEVLRRPLLAETLEAIAEAGPSEDHANSLGAVLAEEVQEFGGVMTPEDVENYKPRWHKPAFFHLSHGDKFYSAPLPGSGHVVAFIFNVLQGFNLTSTSTESYTLNLHRIIETFKFANARRSRLGDNFNYDPTKELLANLTDPLYGQHIRNMISSDYTFPPGYYGPTFMGIKDKGTSHNAVIASNGDAVSVSSTVNGYFGSKRRSPSTGIIFNNQMDDFAVPGVVNSFGLPPTPCNLVTPGQRPMSSTSPTIIVNKDGDVRLAIGAVGGSRIISALSWDRGDEFQVILRIKQGDNMKEAVDYPRIHHQLYPNLVMFEKGFPPIYLDKLKEFGHEVKEDTTESSVYGILRNHDNQLQSVLDYRKDPPLNLLQMSPEKSPDGLERAM